MGRGGSNLNGQMPLKIPKSKGDRPLRAVSEINALTV